MKLLKDANFELRDLEGEIDADTLQSVDMETENPLAVIYQSGYLTIKGYDPEFMLYRLGFPNGEVERGVMKIAGYLIGYSVRCSESPSDNINL